jgi:hypothetical protein
MYLFAAILEVPSGPTVSAEPAGLVPVLVLELQTGPKTGWSGPKVPISGPNRTGNTLTSGCKLISLLVEYTTANPSERRYLTSPSGLLGARLC